MRHYLDTTHNAVLHPRLSRLRGQVGQGRRNPNRRSRKWGGEDIFQTQRIATPPTRSFACEGPPISSRQNLFLADFLFFLSSSTSVNSASTTSSFFDAPRPPSAPPAP